VKKAVKFLGASRRDNGEFEAENVGFGPNRNGSPRSPKEAVSKRRRAAKRKYSRYVAETGAAA